MSPSQTIVLILCGCGPTGVKHALGLSASNSRRNIELLWEGASDCRSVVYKPSFLGRSSWGGGGDPSTLAKEEDMTNNPLIKKKNAIKRNRPGCY